MQISSFCFCPAASIRTGESIGIKNGVVRMNARRSAFSFFQSMRIGTFPRESTRFSATVMFGTSVKCW